MNAGKSMVVVKNNGLVKNSMNFMLRPPLFFRDRYIYIASQCNTARGGMLDVLRQRFERPCQKTDLIVEVFARRLLLLPLQVAAAKVRARRRLSGKRSEGAADKKTGNMHAQYPERCYQPIRRKSFTESSEFSFAGDDIAKLCCFSHIAGGPAGPSFECF
jgi:hypothetical protein